MYSQDFTYSGLVAFVCGTLGFLLPRKTGWGDFTLRIGHQHQVGCQGSLDLHKRFQSAKVWSTCYTSHFCRLSHRYGKKVQRCLSGIVWPLIPKHYRTRPQGIISPPAFQLKRCLCQKVLLFYLCKEPHKDRAEQRSQGTTGSRSRSTWLETKWNLGW